MILDTSAIIAVLLSEPDADLYQQKMLEAGYVCVCAATLAETYIVVKAKFPDRDRAETDAKVNRLLELVDAEVLPFTPEMSKGASDAFAQFGRNHPANLNLGDCMSYAAAKQSGEPLLFKGEDFMQTDIAAV